MNKGILLIILAIVISAFGGYLIGSSKPKIRVIGRELSVEEINELSKQAESGDIVLIKNCKIKP